MGVFQQARQTRQTSGGGGGVAWVAKIRQRGGGVTIMFHFLRAIKVSLFRVSTLSDLKKAYF